MSQVQSAPEPAPPSGPPSGETTPLEGATPSLSAAEALASTPFFAELSPVDLARLVPELEEYHVEQGQAVFRQGDPGDGLYLIRSGTARVTVIEQDGHAAVVGDAPELGSEPAEPGVPAPDGAAPRAQTVMVLEAPAHFGEAALLTDEPRSSSVIAATPLAVWKLPRARFAALVKDSPGLTLRVAATLAKRLAETTREVATNQEQVTAIARATYAALDPAAQTLLRRIAVFSEFDGELLGTTFGPDWSQATFHRLVQEAVFFRPGRRAGWLAFTQVAVREFLLRQLHAEIGERGLCAVRRRAADAILARPDADPADVLELLRAAGDWPRLARLLEERGPTPVAGQAVQLEGYLRALPPRRLWPRPGLVCLLAACCAAQGKLEQAIDVYREAGRRERAAREGPTAAAYQRALAELHEQIGDADESLACLRRAMELEGRPPDACAEEAPRSLTDRPAGSHGDEQDDRWGRAPEGTRPALLAAVMAHVPSGSVALRPLLALVIAVVTALAWFLPPPFGLTPAALRVLVLVIALVVFGFLDVLPEYLIGLLIIAAWVVSGTLPPAVALAGYASSTWVLMVASMAIGAAVARSGLLYRGAIELVRRLPASHQARCLTLAGLGVLFSPGMPSVPGRVMLATPLAQDIADSLRYPDRSGGTAGLTLSTFVGFGMMGALFLTGTPMALIVHSLLPPEVQARMNWGAWFLAALPTHLVLFGLTMLFLLWRYRPAGADDLPVQTLALQQRVLGRLSRDEWSTLAVLGLLLVGFSTQAFHGLDPAWIAVAAVAVLFLLGALDDDAVKQGVNVSFLLYVGVILGFGQIFTHVELDRWLSQNATGLADLTRGSPFFFVLAVALAAALLGILLRPGPIGLLLALALFPTAGELGVNPWVVAITVLIAMNLWLYPQQNLLYLMAYYGTGERGFSHQQARPLAIAYTLFVVVAILASIPYWRWIGLIE